MFPVSLRYLEEVLYVLDAIYDSTFEKYSRLVLLGTVLQKKGERKKKKKKKKERKKRKTFAIYIRFGLQILNFIQLFIESTCENKYQVQTLHMYLHYIVRYPVSKRCCYPASRW